MVNAIDHKIPYTEHTLISISIDLIGIVKLVRDQLVAFASFELHLLLKILIFILLATFCVLFFILIVLFVESLLVTTLVSHVSVLHSLDVSVGIGHVCSSNDRGWHIINALHPNEGLVGRVHLSKLGLLAICINLSEA